MTGPVSRVSDAFPDLKVIGSRRTKASRCEETLHLVVFNACVDC